MSAVKRGLRNLSRNLPRTLLVSLILGLAVALALIVFAVEEGIGNELTEIETEVGTLIEVRPVESYGLKVEEPMDIEILTEINLIPGVSRITPYMVSQLPVDPLLLEIMSTELVTGGGMGSGMGGGQGMRRFFAFGIGLDDTETVLSYGGGSADIIVGRNLNKTDSGKPVAVISAMMAEAFGLHVGDILPLVDIEEIKEYENYEEIIDNQEELQAEYNNIEDEINISIVGIFDSTSRLLGRGAFMSFETVQNLWGEEGELHQLSLMADNIHSVDEISEKLRMILGEDVDVVAYKDIATGVLDERIDSMHSVLQLVLVISLVLVGVVVLATMVLIVRERSSEVGILKALGAFRRDVVTQFGAEALFLGICGYIWGCIFYYFAGSFMGNLLMSFNSMDGTTPERGSGLGGVVPSFGMGTVELNLSIETALYVFASVIIIGSLGGILPGFYASYFKPAEVLRRG